MNRVVVGWGIALSLVLFAGCSDTNQNGTAAKSIGTEGGTLTSADGRLEVLIPAGAFDKATTVSIEPIVNEASRGLGTAYRLTPEGALKAKATLTFHVDEAELGTASLGGLGIAYLNANDGTWYALRDRAVDEGSKTVSVQTDHFSDWSLFEMLFLEPTQGDVRAKHSQTLQIMFCVQDDPDALVVPLTEGCQPLASALNLGAWAVNGSAGGKAGLGSVTGQGATATYTAPDAIPSPDTVAVSVEVGLQGKARGLLVSHLRVVEECPVAICKLTGTAHLVSDVNGDLSQTGDAQVTWEFSQMQGNEAVYTPSGSATAAWQHTACQISLSPSSFPVEATDGELRIDFTKSPPAYWGSATSGDDSGTQTWSCPNSNPYDETGVGATWFDGSGVLADGKTVSGTVSTAANQGSWTFTAP